MIRNLAEAVALFALPFVIYSLAMALRGRLEAVWPRWGGQRMGVLALAGLACVLAGLLLLGLLVPRGEGAYLPAHMEDGHLVPGELR